MTEEEVLDAFLEECIKYEYGSWCGDDSWKMAIWDLQDKYRDLLPPNHPMMMAEWVYSF